MPKRPGTPNRAKDRLGGFNSGLAHHYSDRRRQSSDAPGGRGGAGRLYPGAAVPPERATTETSTSAPALTSRCQPDGMRWDRFGTRRRIL